MVRYDKSSAEKGSKYVKDQRRRGGAKPVAAGGGVIGVIVMVLFAVLGGGDSGQSLNLEDLGFDLGTVPAESGPVDANQPDPDADTVEFMEFLMFDIQETWQLLFAESDLTYQSTNLTLFTGAVQTGCGRATSAVGPFYCPAPNDQGVYIDLDFFNDLSSRFGAPGDFAQAYVVAHEVGHHIQSVTGISDNTRQAQQQDPANKNLYSVRQELQADCFAGVWAHSANQRLTRESGQPIIESNDIPEGLEAAAAVGDDRIQEQAGMTVDPHTWTHGAADQREEWFMVGFNTGNPNNCDTGNVQIDN